MDGTIEGSALPSKRPPGRLRAARCRRPIAHPASCPLRALMRSAAQDTRRRSLAWVRFRRGSPGRTRRGPRSWRRSAASPRDPVRRAPRVAEHRASTGRAGDRPRARHRRSVLDATLPARGDPGQTIRSARGPSRSSSAALPCSSARPDYAGIREGWCSTGSTNATRARRTAPSLLARALQGVTSAGAAAGRHRRAGSE